MKFTTKIFLLAFAVSLIGSFTAAQEGEPKQHEKIIKKSPEKKAHADHTPKHGGQFFMAPNKFHHLEGVMASPSEFRIYFYDNYTKPIPAVPFQEGSKIEAQRVGVDGREMGTPVSLPISVDSSGSFLSAAIPGELPLPLYFTTWLLFPNQKEPDLFNFNVDKVAVVSSEATEEPSLKMKNRNMGKIAMYQCPMKCTDPHDKPGKCPKCGMNMEAVQE